LPSSELRITRAQHEVEQHPKDAAQDDHREVDGADVPDRVKVVRPDALAHSLVTARIPIRDRIIVSHEQPQPGATRSTPEARSRFSRGPVLRSPTRGYHKSDRASRVANDSYTSTGHDEAEAPAPQTHRDGRLTLPCGQERRDCQLYGGMRARLWGCPD
jgi:hypothetical protein